MSGLRKKQEDANSTTIEGIKVSHKASCERALQGTLGGLNGHLQSLEEFEREQSAKLSSMKEEFKAHRNILAKDLNKSIQGITAAGEE